MNPQVALSLVKPVEIDEPTPLMREVPASEIYPIEALGPLRAAAEAIHDVTQAPIAVGAQSVLGVAALAVQGLADVETLHGRAPSSLFLLTVAKSGERKSACDRLAMAAVRAFETELADEISEEAVAHRNKLEIWTERRKAILKGANADPAGTRDELDALGPEPPAPLYPTIVAGEPTLEGIVKHMGRLRPALGLFSDEGGAFVGGHGMGAENRLKTVAGLSRLWDGAPVDRWRAGDGVAIFPGRRLSAHLMLQPVAAAGLLADRIANEQGFLARFLITEPTSAIGTRTRSGHHSASDAALATFNSRTSDRLRFPLPLREGSNNELQPRLLALSGGARSLLQEFSLAVEIAQSKGGELESVTPFASKAAEHAARLAAVMTLFSNPAAAEVGDVTMADAVTLATFYVNESVRLTNASTISRDTADAERLRTWLLAGWQEDFIAPSDATQRGPFKETERNRKLLAVLERHGWLLPIEGGANVLGKHRREAWRIVRRQV